MDSTVGVRRCWRVCNLWFRGVKEECSRVLNALVLTRGNMYQIHQGIIHSFLILIHRLCTMQSGLSLPILPSLLEMHRRIS